MATTNAAETAREGATLDQLRFITCGSVDDGKSTLIGRLLCDAKLILDDQIEALARDSRRHGTTGDELDLALLVDGLEAEREQGITIDVAYRFFSTERRSFIVADTPGHEQYTRNMATGASTADLAVILIDARKGVLAQTRRHSVICSLLGIRHIVLAVNKIDLVADAEAVFRNIVATYRAFCGDLEFISIAAIPLSARFGDNVTVRSTRTPWYAGPTLIAYLETLNVTRDAALRPFRFAVQWVNRPHLDFRGLAGTIASGSVHRGDAVVVAGSGRQTTVQRIVTFDGDLEQATAGDAVTLVLADDLDVGRGELLCAPRRRPALADRFTAQILWMSETPLLAGRSYVLRIGAAAVAARIVAVRHRLDVGTLGHEPATALSMNEIGLCEISTATPIALDPYAENRQTGGFILIDQLTNETAAAGMVRAATSLATNIHRQDFSVDKAQRAVLKGQHPAIVWLTGLSGAGKSTIANLVERRLAHLGYHTMMLDGDNLRFGLNRDLAFSAADRVENIRRAGETAKLMVDAGLIVLCAFISPYRAEREAVRALVGPGEFIEVFVDASIESCMERDPKGLYAKAKSGQLQNMTGVDSPYEAPLSPDLTLATASESIDASVARTLSALSKAGIIKTALSRAG
jgi:bifunctional enzyme CysN/CysC